MKPNPSSITDPAALPLRDIHLPDSTLWWPLAPGWWLLLILIIVIVLLILYFIRHRRQQKLSAIYLAQQELERVESEFKSHKDKSILIKQLSELIRRVSISLFNRNESASLTGEDWLVFLDQLHGDHVFTTGCGRVLIEAPYQANPDYNDTELLSLISSWINSAKKYRVGGKEKHEASQQ